MDDETTRATFGVLIASPEDGEAAEKDITASASSWHGRFSKWNLADLAIRKQIVNDRAVI